MVAAGYGLIRRKRGTKPFLDDSVFRSKVLMFAGMGLSRRGVASMVGISHETLCDWLARGRANPDEEPYASFVVDYQRAGRMLEACAAGSVALICKRIYEVCERGDWAALAEMGPQVKELLNVMAARYPEDWGTSAHRKPEQDPLGEAWLERNAITHGQLVAMFREPSEPVLKALVEAYPQLGGVIGAERKAER